MNSNNISKLTMTESYNKYSTMQFSLIQSSIPMIKQAIELLEINNSLSPIILADFGSSHGSNSIYVMKLIIDLIKQIKKIDRSFLIIHNDLPTNNWNLLFNILNNEEKNSFSFGNGRSFYTQCLPSNCLTLAYSSTSIQWLSKKPCNISEHCHPFYGKIEEIQAFQSQAYDDYKHFLENRSKELISGGILILGIVSVNDENKNGFEEAFDLLYECAKLIPLTNDELINYTYPNYLRSYSECCNNELFQMYSFKLIKSEIFKVDVHFYHQFKNYQITIDEFAKHITNFTRCGTESTLKEVLDKRSNNQIENILKQFWNIYYNKIKENPDRFQLSTYQTFLILKKI